MTDIEKFPDQETPPEEPTERRPFLERLWQQHGIDPNQPNPKAEIEKPLTAEINGVSARAYKKAGLIIVDYAGKQMSFPCDFKTGRLGKVGGKTSNISDAEFAQMFEAVRQIAKMAKNDTEQLEIGGLKE